MSETINLLKGSRQKRFLEEKILRSLRVISFLLLFFVGGTSIVFFFLNRQSVSSSFAGDETTQKAALTMQKEKAVKFLLAEKRLTDIAGIFEKRVNLDTIMAGVSESISSDISVQTLSLDGKKFSITVTSPSLASLDTLLTNVLTMTQEKKTFTKVTMDGLSMDPGKKYYVISFSGDLP